MMKENQRKCAKCGKSPATCPGITLYRFPKPGYRNSFRCESWAKYCYPDEPWSSRQFQEKLHTSHKMLCNQHFESSSFTADGKTLVRSAIPEKLCDKILTSGCNVEPETVSSKKTELQENINILNTEMIPVASTMLTLGDSEPEAGPSKGMKACLNIAIHPVVAAAPVETPMMLTSRGHYEPEAGPSKEAPLETVINPMVSTAQGETPEVSNLNDDKLHKMEHEKKHEQLLILKKKERYLYMKCQKHLKKVNKLEKNMKKLKNEAFLNALLKDESVHAFLETKISPSFALLLQGQLKNYKRKTKGRRWNTEAKIIALRLYKRSPTCYKLLRRLICLPNPSTLKTLLGNFKLPTGTNNQIFNVLKQSCNRQEPANNEYVLMFDEMSIKKNLTYNKKEDLIEGYQDHAEQGRSPQVASHALVFMIAGIRKKVKQPIAYYLSGGSVTADRLAVLIKTVLRSCFSAGLNIAATVCDMDGVNKRALGILGATAELPIVKVDGIEREIVTLFDTPHLLKCFRNNFLKYNIKCTTNVSSDNEQGIGIAKWSHIEQFFILDNSNPNFVFAPSLTKDHLNPNTRQKMKVKLAAQVLSHTVAAGIFAKVAQGELPAEAVVTANILSNMDKLFDCLNSSSADLRRGKPYSTNIKKGSIHLAHFKIMKTFFKNLKFLGCTRSPPSIEGWIWTLNGMETLWKILTIRHPSVKSLSTRRIQQDPLENLFGCIRGHCGSNTNPTAGQFVAGLKTAVLSNLSQVSVGNCEKDENEVMLDNFKMLLTPESDADAASNKNINSNNQTNIALTLEEEDLAVGEIQACAYVCGFIIKNRSSSCDTCDEAFKAETVQECHAFVEHKEYQEAKTSLTYASTNLIMCVEKCACLTNQFLNDKAHDTKVKEKVENLVKTSVNFDFLNKCDKHKNENIRDIVKSVFHICVMRFCTLKNREFSAESSASALKKKIDILKHK